MSPVREKFVKIVESLPYDIDEEILKRDVKSILQEITQKYVTGSITVKLYKGNMTVVSRKAKSPLYWEELATFDKDEIYNQKDAEGFINLFGLPTKVQALMRKGK